MKFKYLLFYSIIILTSGCNMAVLKSAGESVSIRNKDMESRIGSATFKDSYLNVDSDDDKFILSVDDMFEQKYTRCETVLRGYTQKDKDNTKPWVVLFNNPSAAKKFAPYGKNGRENYAYVGIMTDSKKQKPFAVLEVVEKDKNAQVVKLAIPVNNFIYEPSKIWTREVEAAKKRNEEYVIFYASTYGWTYGKTHIISPSYEAGTVKCDDSLQNTRVEKYNRPGTINQVTVSSSRLGIKKMFNYEKQRSVRIDYRTLFKEQIESGTSNLPAKLRINIDVVTGRDSRISKSTTIDLSEFIKTDIVFSNSIVRSESQNSNTEPSPGIGNQLFDAGEKILMDVDLKNTSDNYYISSSAFFSTTSNYIKIPTQNIRYDEIEPGQIKRSPTMIELNIDPETPHGHKAVIDIKVLDSGYEGAIYTSFPIQVAKVGPIGFEKAIVDDDNIGGSEGNGDGIFEPGEIIEFIAFIENQGSVRLKDVIVKITPLDDANKYVRMIEDTHTYDEVRPRADRSIPADYDIEILNNAGTRKRDLRFKIEVKAKAAETSPLLKKDFWYRWEDFFEITLNGDNAKLVKLTKS